MPDTISNVAYNTSLTYLMYKASGSQNYTKLIDIKDYPDLEGERNMLDATTLSHTQEWQIPGIKRLPSGGLQFTCNYTAEDYAAVKALEGDQIEFAVWFGASSTGEPDGSQGKFSWTGDVRTSMPGKGVDEVREMTVTSYPSTDLTFSAT